MELYMALDTDTNEAKIFADYDDFKGFAIEHRYAYNYYSLGETYEYTDVELFYYE